MSKNIETLMEHYRELQEVLEKTLYLHHKTILTIAEKIIKAYRNSKKLIIFGNGGSYADALHFAGELEGAYRNRNRPALPALVPHPAAVTAIANDFNYDQTFKRFVEANANQKDIVIGISTSGNSKNILVALEEARRKKAATFAFTGEGGGEIKKRGLADILLNVASSDTPRIQEAYKFAFHEICDIVERVL